MIAIVFFLTSFPARAQNPENPQNPSARPVPAGKAIPGAPAVAAAPNADCPNNPAIGATFGADPAPGPSRPNAAESVPNDAASGTDAKSPGGKAPDIEAAAPGDRGEPSTAPGRKRLKVNPITGKGSTFTKNYCPLTGRERWRLYWIQNYASVGAYFGPVFKAAVIDQPKDVPKEWGKGGSGFGLRIASEMGIGVVQSTIQAPLAALMHEDPRYIASSARTRKRRLLHAIIFSFATFNNDGQAVPNLPKFASYYAGAAISTRWLPGSRDVGKYALTDGSEELALSVPVNILQEFWPDIKRWIFHRHGG